jgi:hypothetical protein
MRGSPFREPSPPPTPATASTPWVTACTAASVRSKIRPGKMPNTRMSTSMGVQAIHSGMWTSWMWASSYSVLTVPNATRWSIHSR